MARVVLAVAAFALTLYALVECLQTPAARVRNLPKPAWIMLIVIVSLIGPIAWFLGGRPLARPPGSSPPGRPRGPEDDPDFLRNL